MEIITTTCPECDNRIW